MANPFGSFNIPQLRKQSVMDGWGGVPDSTGYDWAAPAIDYSGGEMPEPSVGMNFPPPSVGPVQDGPFPGMFGQPSASAGPTQGAPPTQMAAPTAPRYDYRDTLESIKNSFTPEFTDRNRLRALMDAAPERESPGWGRGLSAIAMGIGTKDPTQALANMEAINYAPHRRAMADWTAKADPFYKTAELENRQNINERTLTSNVITADTQARRLEENARQADQKNEVARTRAEADMIRSRAIDFKNRGAEVTKAGSRLIATFPDGRTMDVGKSGLMDREEELTLMGKNQLAAAQALGGAYFRDPNDPNAPITQNNPRVPGNVPPRGSVPLGTSAPRPVKEQSPADATKEREERWLELNSTDEDVAATTEIKNGKVVRKPKEKANWIFPGKTQEEIDAQYQRATDKMWQRGEYAAGGVKGASNKGGVYTNKYGEKTPYEDAPNDDTSDEGEFVAPDPGPGGLAPSRDAATRGVRAAAPPPPKEAGPGPLDTDPTAGYQAPSFSSPASTPSKPKFQPRGEYGANVPKEGTNRPWFVDELMKPGVTPGATGAPQRQVMTENGPRAVPPGEVAVKNVGNGKILFMPKANLTKAIESGLYTEVK